MKDLTQGSVKRHFFSYLIPSILATLVTSVYTLADTIMIGQYEGDNGLLALNIFLPVYSIYMAIGTLFGVGGGVRYSFYIGRKDYRQAKSCFTNALFLFGITLVLFVAALNIWFEPIMRLFGADDGSLPLVTKYGKYVAWLGAFVAIALFLETFLRNDNNPKLAMAAVVSGGLFNIGLDYILVFVVDMGMAGAALATVVSYILTTLICCAHFFRKDNGLKLHKSISLKNARAIVSSGISSFVIEIALAVMIIIFNNRLLKVVGDYGVVTYGVITNTLIVAISMYNGVAQACQPIASVNYGAEIFDNVKKLRRLAYLVVGAMSVAFLLPVQIAPNAFVHMFTSAPSDKVLALAPKAVRIYFIALPFMGLNIFFTSYYQSVAKPVTAFVLSILRGVVIGGILAYALPPLFGGFSLWFIVPIAEIVTFAVALFGIKKSLPLD